VLQVGVGCGCGPPSPCDCCLAARPCRTRDACPAAHHMSSCCAPLLLGAQAPVLCCHLRLLMGTQ
jgi:hypothetical protein